MRYLNSLNRKNDYRLNIDSIRSLLENRKDNIIFILNEDDNIIFLFKSRDEEEEIMIDELIFDIISINNGIIEDLSFIDFFQIFDSIEIKSNNIIHILRKESESEESILKYIDILKERKIKYHYINDDILLFSSEYEISEEYNFSDNLKLSEEEKEDYLIDDNLYLIRYI